MFKLESNQIPIYALCFVFLILSSCASRKDVVYFQDTSGFETLVRDDAFTSRFKVDDLVSIHISSLNPEASAPFNLYRGASENGFQPEQVDYLVDQSGEIDFPVIGKLKIEGLTPGELRELLRERLFEYLKDPIINIRLSNFTITVLGAVNRPGTYPVNGEQVTILEALGLAGDMTIRGRRDNVLVIRDFKGTKVYNRINLTTKNVVKSPVYYLTQNDVVYVEPNKSGIKETSIDARAQLYVSIISVLITATAILITRS
ncbi:polysaccharide biosynthesis/export family protein [Flagellimonas meridianipacifica]|uniref:Polysaccharide export outer membrane protein n=1 Tax=Flagellimonas meridianipacifica TaxID=1080225 RepID=A0A2T0MCS2_9FLAO|nr:polysaccharide biosynthesis/export family protein [Allomuricauda pacifica]PRX55283.1 polysaccharide export outer membrane protein [Allomuricauda pacifica]